MIKKLTPTGYVHYVLALIVVVLVGIVGTYLLVAGHASPVNPSEKPLARTNLFTSQCPSNKVVFGVPGGKTATVATRQKVFGKPDPNARVEKMQFMGQTVTINRKVAPCLRAVEWDLKNVYHTRYIVHTTFSLSAVDATNPAKYFHPYGAAIDINPAQNPRCATACPQGAPHDLPANWVKAFRAHGFFWGGNFPYHKDYMHFEWHGQK